MDTSTKKILITGATGYVGRRLLKRLETSEYGIRCMAREPSRLSGRVSKNVEIVEGDISQIETLKTAFDGIDTAFFLIHALASKGDFENTEVQGAENFVSLARSAGVQRIIYLGGLGSEGDEHSAHMRSRHAVGDILRNSGIPTIELQASIIIGSGSLSFELIRSLVNRLPVMLLPRWVRVKAQPIFIDDVLSYLVQSINLPISSSKVYEIGGEKQLSYLELMKTYGAIAQLKRVYINVPFLTPWLSSLWLNLVTPLFAQVGRKLIDSISIPSIVENLQAKQDFDIQPIGIKEAIQIALQQEVDEIIESHWADALSSSVQAKPYGGTLVDSKIVDTRVEYVEASAEEVFPYIEQIGGEHGWYYADFLWKLRGILDRMVGGVGMQRGRRHPRELRCGDIVDCWRVEAIEHPHRLLLRAEMKVFGKAWLQFEVKPDGGKCEIYQTALYSPKGLMGYIYWYSLYPLHELIFGNMLLNIKQAVLSDNKDK